MLNIEVNNKIIKAKKGETILHVLRRNGIQVPTLCNMKDFSPTGACRMCVVEVEGSENLLPSCSYTVAEGMRIRTHSPRVLKARKTIVELLLSNHPDDCLYCERNGNCELQKMAEDMNIRERRIPGRKSRFKIDKSSASIIRDPAKCILCGRCVRICEEMLAVSTFEFIFRGSKLIIAPEMNKPLNFSNCISCGQCVNFCPTGALTEKSHFAELDDSLHDPAKTVVTQYSPAVAISIAEEFQIKPGKDCNGLINAALRKIGFSKIFETSFGADLLIIEQAEEFLNRLKENNQLPLITGNCPAWIKFAEQQCPDILKYITKYKSPSQINGALIKSWVADKNNISPGEIYSVSITPCIAGKMEAQRSEMTQHGLSDIDSVLTTRELIRLIRLNGIDMHNLIPEITDEPLEGISSAGKLADISGGHLESLLRTIYYKYLGEELNIGKLSKLRISKEIKELTLNMGDKEITVVAVSGMANLLNIIEGIRNNKCKYHIIEVMACPGGCINGGGQPITCNENILKTRSKSLYDFDNSNVIKTAHKNPQIINIYNDYLIKPAGDKSKNLFTVNYAI